MVEPLVMSCATMLPLMEFAEITSPSTLMSPEEVLARATFPTTEIVPESIDTLSICVPCTCDEPKLVSNPDNGENLKKYRDCHGVLLCWERVGFVVDGDIRVCKHHDSLCGNGVFFPINGDDCFGISVDNTTFFTLFSTYTASRTGHGQ